MPIRIHTCNEWEPKHPATEPRPTQSNPNMSDIRVYPSRNSCKTMKCTLGYICTNHPCLEKQPYKPPFFVSIRLSIPQRRLHHHRGACHSRFIRRWIWRWGTRWRRSRPRSRSPCHGRYWLRIARWRTSWQRTGLAGNAALNLAAATEAAPGIDGGEEGEEEEAANTDSNADDGTLVAGGPGRDLPVKAGFGAFAL